MENIILILLVILLIEVTYSLVGPRLLSKKSQKGGVFIDTSALMDGRIVTAAQTGFMPSRLIIPKSVLSELQLLADQADQEKRSRARRGLDAVHELQAIEHITVFIMDDASVKEKGVDDRLLTLASKYHGSICTIDFNLNKVAAAQGIFVLNINDLAGSIRMAFLPGETISLALTQKGQSSDQAVGYLADGTMVVVDKAASHIGKTLQVEFIRSLQTAAGRMMFAKVSKDETSPDRSQSARVNKRPTGTKQKPKTSTKSGQAKSNEDSLIELVNNQ